MKIINVCIALCFVQLLFHGVVAQNDGDVGYISDHSVICRVSEEYREYCFTREIGHPLMSALLNELEAHAEKIFPFHTPPSEKYDRWGNPLVDLSLIYRVEYQTNMLPENVCQLLMSTGMLEYAEFDVIPEILYTPNDPHIGNQYYLNTIKAYQAWDIWKGDSNYVAGIVDTGYDLLHPDLINALKYNWNDTIDGFDNDNDGYIDNFRGWNLGSNNNNPQAIAQGHGIHVSGIAGASVDNTFGMAGVGFKTKILPVKIDNQNGALIRSYEGIVYAADHGANTINCSWGSTFGSGQFGIDIVNYATYNKKSLVVGAAGNSNNERLFYPCSYQNVLCVAGTKADDAKWENSSYYWRVDISAPGHNVYSCWANGTFVYSGGTSMAAPAVAGAAALVWSYFPFLEPLQVYQHLKNTADIIDTISYNIPYFEKLGYGRLNMYLALVDTFKPGVQLRSLDVTDNNDSVFLMNDTLCFTGHFVNYLAPTQDLQIQIECNSDFVELIDSVWDGGVRSTMESFENGTPFRVRLLPGMPSSHEMHFVFRYTDPGWEGRDHFFVTANLDFLNINVNNITTTVTSKSTLGYNDYLNYQQGSGFSWNNSSSIVSCAGLVVGRASSQVSDNIYGFSSGYDFDFVPVESVEYVVPPLKGDQQISGKFNDAANPQSMDVTILHNVYAWDSPGHENYIILEYNIINDGDVGLSNLYTGFFADWELKVSSQNSSKTDLLDRYGYVYAIDSSLYGAIQLLTTGNFNHYAIDNDGQDGSVNMLDGFSSTEKFMTLTNTRNVAGVYQFGNDVSQVVSTGPWQIAVGDTITVAFAMHVAGSLNDLEQSVSSAATQWNNMVNAGMHNPVEGEVFVWPNPFVSQIHVCSGNGSIVTAAEIIDMTGKTLLNVVPLSSPCFELQTSALPDGIYILKLYGTDETIIKLIKTGK